MSKYNFVSPGAVAGNAIEEFLRQRMLEQRQQMLDSVAIGDRQADNARADLAEARMSDTARMAAEDRDRAQSAREDENNYRRAANYALTGVPGVIDPGEADNLRKYGFGGLLSGTPGAGQDVPGVLEFRGGTQYQSARQAAQEREAQAREALAARGDQQTQAQQAAAERAAADRALRLQVAQMGASGKSETNALRNDLLRSQISEKQQKQDDAAKADQAKADAVTQYQNDITSVIDQLIDKNGNLLPDTAGIVGMLDARTPDISESANSAKQRVERLIGMLDINKLREMKAQSKTGASGFGALSEKELNVLENAASGLRNRGQREGDYAAELKRIRDSVNKGGAAAPAAGGRVRVMAPDGTVGTVPAAQLEQALAKGYKQAQ